jgi:MerR family mercuric resistance operon transcriptional regulator
LKEIGTLLSLEYGTDRHAIRKVADDRLDQVRNKIVDLQRMEKVLAQVIDACEATAEVQPCPIIAVLTGGTS